MMSVLFMALPHDLRKLEARVKKGDMQALGDLLEAIRETQVRWVQHHFGLPREVAEDLVQEAHRRVVANITTFRWTSSLVTWSYGVLRNVCREYIRGRKEENDFDPQDLIDPKATGFEDRVANRLVLVECLKTLPEHLRLLVSCVYYSLMPQKDVADLMNVTESAVSRQLRQARQLLRICVEGGSR